MRRLIITMLAFSALAIVIPTQGQEFLFGADVSYEPQVTAGGGVYYNAGEATDLFVILQAHGLNIIRLRLWHSPFDGNNSLAETLSLAERAKAAGCGVLLDFHFSDTWADPGHQDKPAAWTGLTTSILADSIRIYTHEVLEAFAARNVSPAMVQLGNEITSGLLWENGRVGGTYDTPDQWRNLAVLLKAAIEGIETASAGKQRPAIMIHLDRGGDNTGARWFFDKLIDHGVDFDLIGLSYYPWWHGTLADLEANLNDLARRYGKDLVVVETAYPWTLQWFDNTHNLVGEAEQLLNGIPATPAGQQKFLNSVTAIVRATPNGRGRGVVWWAPESIAAPGFGSGWENVTLFDERGQVLPALRGFARDGVADKK